jgi:hypothetical protein
LDGALQFGVGLRRKNAGLTREGQARNSHLDLGMGTDILQPIRGLVLGDDVKAPAEMGEPDFDFP